MEVKKEEARGQQGLGSQDSCTAFGHSVPSGRNSRCEAFPVQRFDSPDGPRTLVTIILWLAG